MWLMEEFSRYFKPEECEYRLAIRGYRKRSRSSPGLCAENVFRRGKVRCLRTIGGLPLKLYICAIDVGGKPCWVISDDGELYFYAAMRSQQHGFERWIRSHGEFVMIDDEVAISAIGPELTVKINKFLNIYLRYLEDRGILCEK